MGASGPMLSRCLVNRTQSMVGQKRVLANIHMCCPGELNIIVLDELFGHSYQQMQ